MDLVERLRVAREKRLEEGITNKTLREKYNEKPTRKAAIDLFCQECMGGEDEPGVRSHIRKCTATKCPLYPYRPYK